MYVFYFFVNVCNCCNCLSVPLLEFSVTSLALSGGGLAGLPGSRGTGKSAGTGHRHGHSEKRRGYQDTPILQRRKHRKTRFDVKIRELLLQKLPILKKPLRISSKIVCQRVHNNVFCSRAQTTCWIFVCGIYENLPRWTTYESPSIYSRKRATLLRCNTLM